MEKKCEFKLCGKQYEAKRPASRFCSDSCRVREHRLHGKKEGGLTTKAKIDIIFNKVQELSLPVLKESPKISPVGTVFQNQPETRQAPLVAHKDFNYYANNIRDCEDPDLYASLAAEVRSHPYLSQKQKQSLLNNQF